MSSFIKDALFYGGKLKIRIFQNNLGKDITWRKNDKANYKNWSDSAFGGLRAWRNDGQATVARLEIIQLPRQPDTE